MKNALRYIVIGTLLALLAIRCFYLFYSPFALELFALFFAYTACVYLGAALSDSRMVWLSVEFALSLVFFTFAALGLVRDPAWLAAGFILHGIWDMLHHPAAAIKTKVVKWFPPLCAVFDFVVAAYLLVFF